MTPAQHAARLRNYAEQARRLANMQPEDREEMMQEASDLEAGAEALEAQADEKVKPSDLSAAIWQISELIEPFLPPKAHEGPCTPESGCDQSCADLASFSAAVVKILSSYRDAATNELHQCITRTKGERNAWRDKALEAQGRWLIVQFRRVMYFIPVDKQRDWDAFLGDAEPGEHTEILPPWAKRVEIGTVITGWERV